MVHRILRLITWLPNGGIERKIVAVLPRLNRELFDVHLCCIRKRGPLADELEAQGVPVHVIPFRTRWDMRGIRQLRGLVSELGISLVHSHMYRANTPATVLKLLDPALVTVGQYHNIDTWESWRQCAVDRWMAHRRDMNVAVSEAVRLNVRDRLGLPDFRTRTIHNCVDCETFRPIAAVERHRIREQLGIPLSARLVIMVARLVPQKNHPMVIRCVRDIAGEVPGAHFLFVGGGGEQPRLLTLAAELGVADHVTFLGNRTDVPRLLAAADISILPSFKEGFSNAVLESMASGLPVVASDVGGNREIVDHGTNGYIIDVTRGAGARAAEATEVNALQFVRHVKRLLADDGLRRKFSGAARETATAFSLDNMVRSVEDLYLELLEGKREKVPDAGSTR